MKKGMFLLLVFISCSYSLQLRAQEPSELKQEIMDRCRESMGEYGASMVKACVDQDMVAINKVIALQKTNGPITNRCLNTMRDYGFAMVLACAEQDIEAEEALDGY